MPSINVRVADLMRIRGYLPEPSGKALVAAVKAKLLTLLADPSLVPLDVEPVPKASTHSYLWLNADEEARLLQYGEGLGLSSGATASALLLRDFAKWEAEQPKATEALASPDAAGPPASASPLQRALARRGSTIRREQARVIKSLQRLDDAASAASTSDAASDTASDATNSAGAGANSTTARRTALDALNAAARSRVLFMEAGTGVGKTMAYLGYLVDYLAQAKSTPSATQKHCYVAVPTFALMSQVANDLLSFGEDAPSTVYVAGTNEWISETALRSWIDDANADDPSLPDLTDWVQHGGNGVRPRWSKVSLMSSVPAFKFVDDCTVAYRLSDDDGGWRAYLDQFERCQTSDLVVVTHAMLAHLVKHRLNRQAAVVREDPSVHASVQAAIGRWREGAALLLNGERDRRYHEALNDAMADEQLDAGLDRLPNIDRLIVDEGHALEDAFALAFSDTFSLRSILLDVRKAGHDTPGVFPSAAIAQLDDHIRAIVTSARSRGPDDVVALGGDDNNVVQVLRGALEAVLALNPSASKAKQAKVRVTRGYRHAQRLLASLRALDSALGAGVSTAAGFLHWSPVRDYPRISIGRTRLDREFDYLWTVVASRSALVSGTLYAELPSLSCETIRRALAVRPEYVMTMEPIHAQWQIDRVQLCMISNLRALNGRARYVRPSTQLPPEHRSRDYAAWIADVVGYLRQLMDTSVGGCLALATAYSDARALAEELPPLPPGWCVLVQEPGISLYTLREEFLARSRTEKVMLIAVGGAWTGFDLWDPANPDALTDLVLIKAPFGMGQETVSKLRRAASRSGHFDVSSAALLLVRQAAGRLIRSPDVPPNRRLHWLDARIHDPARAGMMLPIKRFLDRYGARQIATG